MSALGNAALGAPLVIALLVGLFLVERTLQRRERRARAEARVRASQPVLDLRDRPVPRGRAAHPAGTGNLASVGDRDRIHETAA